MSIGLDEGLALIQMTFGVSGEYVDIVKRIFDRPDERGESLLGCFQRRQDRFGIQFAMPTSDVAESSNCGRHNRFGFAGEVFQADVLGADSVDFIQADRS